MPAGSVSRVPVTDDSTSGKTRVPRPSKPPAKTARKTPRCERSPVRGKFTSAWRRNVADRWVVHWRVQDRLPWSEIVARDGRAERTLRAVVDDYLENVQEGDFVRPLGRDPIELVESMLNELAIMRDTVQAIVASSENEAVIVAAVREWRRIVKEVRELLQATGKLPRDLSVLRHLVEVRELSDVLDGLLDRLESGDITPQAVRTEVARTTTS